MSSPGKRLRMKVHERCGWVCFRCGEKLTEQTATVDHIRARSLGGDDSDENLQSACLKCNQKKAAWERRQLKKLLSPLTPKNV